MITVGYITKSLSQQFSEVGDQSLSPRFKAINDRVNGGYIMSIRKLELELLQAGKVGKLFLHLIFTQSLPVFTNVSPSASHDKIGLSLGCQC